MYTITELLKTNRTVFTNEELAYIWDIGNENTLKKTIQYLTKKGKLIRIKRGLYSVDGRPYNVFELANKYKAPSYISFTTVLLKAGVIFQYSDEVYLAAQDSRTFTTGNHTFHYRKIKDEVLFDKTGLINEYNYTIATTERAFLDMLYLDRNFYFDNMRSIDFDKCLEIVEIYNNKSLTAKVKELKKRKEQNV